MVTLGAASESLGKRKRGPRIVLLVIYGNETGVCSSLGCFFVGSDRLELEKELVDCRN
jgi:hypothetical protein